ncbi:uncharacterized protein EV420DRAFT_1485876 [Desarmillaria tabescens]|uniref:Uncharacterized protein n=1 Tax=Armillaria tabescens TaxID=1929756 RepID=A0AA39JF56_ARMTA|nr:uncharacterized protein EV420DRAFT_1485876 [Desarmillaria tabescens]KAK0440666.1 hypothetical protein EV420DRAFT_1485876 [Desarmillaria tabescens]
MGSKSLITHEFKTAPGISVAISAQSIWHFLVPASLIRRKCGVSALQLEVRCLRFRKILEEFHVTPLKNEDEGGFVAPDSSTTSNLFADLYATTVGEYGWSSLLKRARTHPSVSESPRDGNEELKLSLLDALHGGPF